MNTYLLNVLNAGTSSHPCPSLCFKGRWLHQIGFVSGALVKAIPMQGGMEFILHGEYIPPYSGLVASTREQGRNLIQVCCNSPVLETSGTYLRNAGINCGDALIARYGYGIIRARKLPAMAKAVIVTSSKGQGAGIPTPKLWLAGNWLPEFGFTPKTAVAAISWPGQISYEIVERLSDLCFSSQYKVKLIQVNETGWGGRDPYIRAPGPCLAKAGFTIGDTLFASCRHGLITLQRLDFEALGF